jgi:hypothetical protein
MHIGIQTDSRTDQAMDRWTDIFTSTANNKTIKQYPWCVFVCVCFVCVCVCFVCVCVGSIRQQSTKAYGEPEAQHHTFLSTVRILC